MHICISTRWSNDPRALPVEFLLAPIQSGLCRRQAVDTLKYHSANKLSLISGLPPLSVDQYHSTSLTETARFDTLSCPSKRSHSSFLIFALGVTGSAEEPSTNRLRMQTNPSGIRSVFQSLTRKKTATSEGSTLRPLTTKELATRAWISLRFASGTNTGL